MTADKPSSSSNSNNNSSNNNQADNNNKDVTAVNVKNLPLVPQAVLKKRHEREDAARLRLAAARNLGRTLTVSRTLTRGRRSDGNKDGGPKQVLMYVKRPETIVAKAIMRRCHNKRFFRVQRLGMGKRASDKPQFAMKEIVDEEEEEEVKEQEAEEQEEQNEEDMEVDETDTDKDKKKKKVVTKEKKKVTTVVKYQTNSVGAPMVFVVRIRDHFGCPDTIRKVLAGLRLRQKHDGVFVRYTKKNRRLLHSIEPWITYGTPSRAAVVDLLERRGYGRIRHKLHPDKVLSEEEKEKMPRRRVPLSDNVVIEEALGQCCNILCKEDLVHALCSRKPNKHFDHVAEFLWSFRLADTKTDMERKLLRVKDTREDYGDRGEAITEYIQNVL